MVERRWSNGGKVRIEIVPWLTQPFGQKGSSRLILEEEVDREINLVDFLLALAEKYPAVREVILNSETGELFDHVNVVYNDAFLSSSAALAQGIKSGDVLTFLPAFVGG